MVTVTIVPAINRALGNSDRFPVKVKVSVGNSFSTENIQTELRKIYLRFGYSVKVYKTLFDYLLEGSINIELTSVDDSCVFNK